MKYRILHLLIVMTLVALWLPLSKWLLSVEALDHPRTPHTTADFVGFYFGSMAIVVLPLFSIGLYKNLRRKPLEATATDK